MLRILQRSCDRLGLRHVVLTDLATFEGGLWPKECAGFRGLDVPLPLMRACTELQAQWLEEDVTRGGDTLFVGADCILLDNPAARFPIQPDLCVTYRDAESRYPINTGAQLCRGRLSRSGPSGADTQRRIAALFRRIADRCGVVWCDDQRAVMAELAPMPSRHGHFVRGGILVGFMPMNPFNWTPKSPADRLPRAVMAHFRGKNRKTLFFEWAKEQGFAS